MKTRYLHLLAGLILLVLPIGGTTAQAATYISASCDCSPTATESCRCDNLIVHDLCAFCTKEFRGKCKGVDAVGFGSMSVTGRKENTTCTQPAYPPILNYV
ncbi:MAG: hypothetical protein O7G88_08585 [bacterium]|nr:hypothetical protein [bacterium]